MIVGKLFAALAVVLVHSWYPVECCDGDGTAGECHPVPCQELRSEDGGLVWQGIYFEPNMRHRSQDGGCHVCVEIRKLDFGVIERSPHCVFVPLTTSRR